MMSVRGKPVFLAIQSGVSLVVSEREECGKFLTGLAILYTYHHGTEVNTTSLLASVLLRVYSLS